MNELTKGQKQLILLSKGWFDAIEYSLEEKLKYLVAYSFKIPFNSVENYHVYDFIIDTFYTLEEMGYIKENKRDFMKEIFGKNSLWTISIDRNCVIKKLLSLMSMTTTKDLDLDEPDFSIFNIT